MASSSYAHSPSFSSSSTSFPSTGWDVFLSFSGKDTRYTFTEFLYEALHRHGVRTFMDDRELPSGDIISDSLKQAIQESKTYVVVFSKNYASSGWCLDELVMIKSMGRLIIPVFYNIDPSVVRHQTGRFRKALKKHETRFNMDILDKWRVTLTTVVNLSGYHVLKNMSQANIINKVVERILLEINPTTLEVAKYPVGLDFRVKYITTLLSSDTEGVIRIGIHGMGGVGKTTLAKAVYNQIYHRFQGSCFLANVREVSATKGLVCLQEQLINDVLKCKNISIDNVDRGIELIKARVCFTKILLVIDDLHDHKSLEFLEGPFALGSIIVITTRNEDLLDSINVKARYKVNTLGDAESSQLFAQHAFGDNNISDTFTELSKEILERAGGLPLALKVFGSNLFNQSEEGWRWFINNLKRVSVHDVEKRLVVSFDALKLVDPDLQDMFLDIACFFIGGEKEEVVKIMETCYTFVNYNIDILVKRCLLTINDEDKLQMHDLLRDMGREIARNKSPTEPEKHSRLWVSKDICHVLTTLKGTEAIEGIIPGKFYNQDALGGVSFAAQTFKRMSKLRFLYLSDVNITGSFEHTFKDLKFLRWEYCPLKCLPSEFYPQKLSVLALPNSKLRTIWELNMASQVFEKLKSLNLSHSQDLTTTPDFKKLPSLETLDLSGRIGLKDVHISVGSLVGLVSLNLNGCANLRSLPDTICNLRALEVLSIRRCKSLEALPIRLGNMESLKELHATELTISTLPDSIGHLSKLVILRLTYNINLEILPDTICNLRALEVLNIEACISLKALPVELGNIESLKWAGLNELNVSTLPDSIGRLTNLVHLRSSWNEDLENLPHTISSLKSLQTLDIFSCRKLEILPNQLWMITSLMNLKVGGATKLRNLPNIESSQGALSLRHLDVSKSVITALPSGICQLSNLVYLILTDCCRLLFIAELPLNLKCIEAEGCTSLSGLVNVSNLKQLEVLNLSKCSSLKEIEGLRELTSITQLHLGGCNSSLLASTFTKCVYQIYSEFGREIRIYTSEIPDWISRSSNCAGSTLSLDLPPNVSHNYLAMILCFKHLGTNKYSKWSKYSVKNFTSGFIRTNIVHHFEAVIIIVPRTSFLIRDGDGRIEFTSDAHLFGIHLLYKT